MSKYTKTSGTSTSTLADSLGIGDRYKKKEKPKKDNNNGILKYFKDLMKGSET